MSEIKSRVKAIQIIADEFSGDRIAFAMAADASPAQVNNWVSQDRDFLFLANGDYVLENEKMKKVKIPSKVKGKSTAHLVQYAKNVLKNAGFEAEDIAKIFRI